MADEMNEAEVRLGLAEQHGAPGGIHRLDDMQDALVGAASYAVGYRQRLSQEGSTDPPRRLGKVESREKAPLLQDRAVGLLEVGGLAGNLRCATVAEHVEGVPGRRGRSDKRGV